MTTDSTYEWRKIGEQVIGSSVILPLCIVCLLIGELNAKIKTAGVSDASVSEEQVRSSAFLHFGRKELHCFGGIDAGKW